MKSHIVKIKDSDMLCHRCVLNVVKALSQISGIQEFNVSLETKRIEIVYNDKRLTRGRIVEIVDEAIVNGKVRESLLQ